MYVADVPCSQTYRWTQVAEIVGTRHAERKESPKISSFANIDHPVQSAPSAGSIPSTLVSIIATGTAMKTNCSWKASPGTVATGRPSAAKNYQIAPPPTSRIGQSTSSSVPPGGPSNNAASRHTMLVRKPPSHTASTRTRETSPRFSNAEQFMDDDFTLNETFWDEVSTNDQILPDALNALFPQDLDTTTAETSTHSSAADTPLQRSRRDSSIALTATTNTSASPANSTTYRPPTADMYDSNLNPLATGMWPSDWWVASPQQAQATPTRIDVSSSSNNIPTTQNDDSLWTDILPTIPPPDPLRPASSLAHDPTEYSTTNAPLDLMTLDADMPPTRQNRTDPKPLVGEPSSLDEDVNSDIEERLARKRKRLARGASLGTSKSRTTLVLEDVEPETLKAVMDTLLQSKTRISIAHGSDDGIAK